MEAEILSAHDGLHIGFLEISKRRFLVGLGVGWHGSVGESWLRLTFCGIWKSPTEMVDEVTLRGMVPGIVGYRRSASRMTAFV